MSAPPADPAQQLAAAALARPAGDRPPPRREYRPPSLDEPPRPPLTIEQLRRRTTLSLWVTALALLLAAAALLRPLLDDGVLRAESLELSAPDSPWQIRLDAGADLAGLIIDGGPTPPVALTAREGQGGQLQLTESAAGDPSPLRGIALTPNGLTRIGAAAPDR